MNFSDSFDSVLDTAKEAAGAAAKKTRQLAEIAKANVAIYAQEDKIKKAERELGKLYYRDYAVEEEADIAEYLPWCKRIDEAKKNIADLRDYIDGLKDEENEAVAADTEEEDFVAIPE